MVGVLGVSRGICIRGIGIFWEVGFIRVIRISLVSRVVRVIQKFRAIGVIRVRLSLNIVIPDNLNKPNTPTIPNTPPAPP